MSISISCSASPFVAQKGRKLLVPVPITLFAPIGFPQGAQCQVRVSLIARTSAALSLQAIPGTWDAVNTGAIASVQSPPFDPNGALPLFTVFPSFLDSNGLKSATTGYSSTYLVEVIDSAQAQQGSVQFVLSGSATPVQSVNVVFALDHGSTMATTNASNASRLDRLRAAFTRGLALLRDDDTLGVVSFGNLHCALNPQLRPDFATLTQQTAATALSNGLALDGSLPPLKPIQMGIDAARLLAPNATLVLLTDGVNTNVAGHVLTQPLLPTSALIIGEDPSQIPASAPRMVSANGHYAFASARTLGEFAIEKLLTQVLIGLAGSTFISDPEGSLGPGETQSFPLHITEADRELELIVFSNDADALDIRLPTLKVAETAPPSGGAQYDERSADIAHQTGKSPEGREASPHKGVRVKRFPLPALTPNDHGPVHVVTVSRSRAGSLAEAPVRFNLLAVAKTDLTIDAAVTASGLTVGSDLLFSAVLSEYGQGWARAGVSVHVELSHPDGGVETFPLEECALGRFQASLRSFRVGVHTAHFVATGLSLLQKRPFQRECVRTVAVFPPSSPGCPPEELLHVLPREQMVNR